MRLVAFLAAASRGAAAIMIVYDSMARGDFPRRRCKVILVGWFKTNRSYHEDSSPQPRDCARNCCSYRIDRHGQIVCCADQWPSIKAAVPAVTTDVRYQVRRGHPYPSYWGHPTYNSYSGYPAYSSYWGYPTDNSYYGAYGYGYYRSACAPRPRVGAFATAPWTDAPECPPY